MTTSPTIADDTARFIKFLEDADLITDEHALTVSLLTQLVEQLPTAANATQFAALSKEIRATMEALPKPEVRQSDEVQDFFDELTELGDV
ncbi:hypothetical protein [Arthrobacter sp. CJ23]|uniref:hypothetical protein n=1 Tax=Arthrobacter sp. CJ23 TaxID=2972479 RepID=UPI00215CE7E0|nr:hypothetical protein [Arthrobacter sp. CJ23]UVJ37977.1 hypothetical protein NVV90_11940 [Arthrobacter sp. CJ23]